MEGTLKYSQIVLITEQDSKIAEKHFSIYKDKMGS